MNYDYGFWKLGNIAGEKNEFKLKELNKPYTSYVKVDTVLYSGKSYGCVKTNVNKIPGTDDSWTELLENTAAAAWNATTLYKGEDAEAYSIASWYLNQKANRHRTVDFTTKNLSYLKYTIGDIVGFVNCPMSLLGMNIFRF